MKTAFARSLCLAPLVILFQMITVATAVPPQLVKDINATLNATGSEPQNFCAVGSVVFFTATDITHGTELWKSDGTLSGTVLLKNIGPGDTSSHPANLTVVGNKLYFTAHDGVVGFRLWMSDGTSAGTVPVQSIVDASNLTVVGNTLYFMLNYGSTGNELWKIDDIVAGPILVKNIGESDLDSGAIEMTAAGSTLFFMTRVSQSHSSPYRLWKSNGTEFGTVPVKDFVNDGYDPQVPPSEPPARLFYLTAVGNTLFFAACDEMNGWQLWKSDGTGSGTRPVKDILHGLNNSHPVSLTAVGSNLYFATDSEFDDADKELWKSDGTDAGTVKVMDIENGSSITNPSLLTALNNTLYFGASHSGSNRAVWKSNDMGTVVLKDIEPSALAAVGSTLYIAAMSNQLWKSDGTTPGTVEAINLNTGRINPLTLKAVGNALYFQADDTLHGYEPWKTVDSVEGAFMVKDIYGGSNSSTPSTITAVGSVSFFVADDGIHGRELWKSDGTVDGTFMVKDINPGGMGAQPSDLTALGDMLYFKAYDPSNGYELWRSDGTESGTFMVRDILFGSEGSDPLALTVMNNNLYFTANNNSQLWKSDGTLAGTVLIKNVAILSWAPLTLTVVGNALYFAASNGSNGYELWKSDGTTAGTGMLKDIYVGFESAYPQGMTVMGGALYFRANDGINGYELWKSDGTEGGTARVKDINPGVNGSSPEDLVVAGSTLYFRAFNNASGFELWKSNGTDVGTVLVKDVVIGDGSSYPMFMTALNSTVYFMTNGGDGSTGSELWKSDGTPGGTGIVKDINSGSGNGYPAWLTAMGNTLYFIADDGINGQELWKTNGTEIGTVTVADLTGDTGSATPFQVGKIGNQLYFNATTDPYGSELYVYTTPLPGVKTLVATNTSPTGAALNGTVNPNGSATTALFEYGTSTAYGSTVAVTISPNNDSANHSVSATLAGLTANTIYHFRLKATNAEGSVYTSDGTFVAALSSEARLSNLTLSSGTLSPTFAGNITSYTAVVANGISSLTATPTVLESHATVKVNTVAVTSGSASTPINLSVGSNLITVVGTAQNGVNTQGYIITVTRQTPYQTWIDSLTGGSGSLPLADIEHDGLVNLLEYAFGTNPSENNPGAMSVINSTTITPGTPKAIESGGMKALFIRRKDWAASGLTYTVQFSPSLTLWENSVTVPTVVADDGTLQAVTVPFPALINGEPARFFRVQVNGQ